MRIDYEVQIKRLGYINENKCFKRGSVSYKNHKKSDKPDSSQKSRLSRHIRPFSSQNPNLDRSKS